MEEETIFKYTRVWGSYRGLPSGETNEPEQLGSSQSLSHLRREIPSIQPNLAMLSHPRGRKTWRNRRFTVQRHRLTGRLRPHHRRWVLLSSPTSPPHSKGLLTVPFTQYTTSRYQENIPRHTTRQRTVWRHRASIRCRHGRNVGRVRPGRWISYDHCAEGSSG